MATGARPGAPAAHRNPGPTLVGVLKLRHSCSDGAGRTASRADAMMAGEQHDRHERTTCVVVGGGPAGIVTALLLARAGVEVTVLEKHGDFLRDFRGDTVHPSTLRLLDELGLFPAFDAVAHSRIERVRLPTASGEQVTVADFTRLPLAHPYVAMAPQWDLLSLLAEAGAREPAFRLEMNAEVTGLLRGGRDGTRVTGVRYSTPVGEHELRADVTIAADGRWSVARAAAGLAVREFPMNIDVWWFRIPTARGIGAALLPRSAGGRPFIVIPRNGYAQVAHLIPKGADASLRARGIEALRADLALAVPELADAVGAVSFDDVKMLDVRLSRVRRWYTSGFLCIGDAAHAMSPMGGVGINLAVQDGVATARLLAGPLLSRTLSDRRVAAVERRRRLPTVLTQALQRAMHVPLGRMLRTGSALRAPAPLLALLRIAPALAVVPAAIVGVGVRPERAPAFARRSPPGAGTDGAPRDYPGRDGQTAEE
ncbi:FAD-dependent oxidoreductase [Labedella phragmitis]|uniref:FAD-dependent oxidoreductase n=1 Tax=Labedella phragmitis TaxID=2498849 RepID=UPI001AA0A1DB|nr:FAD-dependent oxidoreductase [Labedella phragmitis]